MKVKKGDMNGKKRCSGGVEYFFEVPEGEPGAGAEGQDEYPQPVIPEIFRNAEAGKGGEDLRDTPGHAVACGIAAAVVLIGAGDPKGDEKRHGKHFGDCGKHHAQHGGYVGVP